MMMVQRLKMTIVAVGAAFALVLAGGGRGCVARGRG